MNTAKRLFLTSLQYAYEALLADWKRVSEQNLLASPETCRKEVESKVTELVNNTPKDEINVLFVNTLCETVAKHALFQSIKHAVANPDISVALQSEIDRLKAVLTTDETTTIVE